MERRRLDLSGIVQGVGFRPFVYRLAHEYALSGFVYNHSGGLVIEIEGPRTAVEGFVAALPQQAPPAAHITALEQQSVALHLTTTFEIRASVDEEARRTAVSPDLATCPDCLRELFDPTDRRYGYPFINCTNCGPRYTIIERLPYDRPFTSMADFALCPDCAAEYRDPLNRRFHAQPNACPVCGPRLRFRTKGLCMGTDPIACAAEAIREGKIVAIKGLGGYHLACDATNEVAVELLRVRKRRPDKPFALMARDLAAARAIAEVTEVEARVLSSPAAPIVLLERHAAGVAFNVAPSLTVVGVMLPYTPLHHLLMAAVQGPIVLTSGNLSGEPIIIDDDDAREMLPADAWLTHNRRIVARCEDSVVRVIDEQPQIIRRARGYAPTPMRLPFEVSVPTFAVGGDLKNSFALAVGRDAYLSPYLGDMSSYGNQQAFAQTRAHYQALFDIEPEHTLIDAHPAYAVSKPFRDAAQTVQHHHAHLVAVMVEHALPRDHRVIGFSFDGTGYGTDGTVWGGEVLLADYRGFERVAHLAPLPLVGGDQAVQRPDKTALAYLWACDIPWSADFPPVQSTTDEERRILRTQLARNLNRVATSSMGRLFDVVASLVGVCQRVTYEGQAAMMLEAHTTDAEAAPYPWQLDDGGRIELAPLLAAIVQDRREGASSATVANRFHATVTEMILHIACALRTAHGLTDVVLSGGVFQNAHLTSSARRRLSANQFHVYTARQIPPNDGGLALGQLGGSTTCV